MRAFWAERRRRMKALRPVKGHLVLLANQMLYSILRIMKATRQIERLCIDKKIEVDAVLQSAKAAGGQCQAGSGFTDGAFPSISRIRMITCGNHVEPGAGGRRGASNNSLVTAPVF